MKPLAMLVEEMRRLGIVSFKGVYETADSGHHFEVVLGPEPAPPPAAAAEPEDAAVRANRERREALEILMHSSGADVDRILEAMRP